jgi:hypothetical protein
MALPLNNLFLMAATPNYKVGRTSNGAHLCGELAQWPDKESMASLLQSAGIRMTVGQYSIRLIDFSHFIFQTYGGDLGDPQIEASADDVETLAAEAKRISDIFAKAGLAHRFEIYQDGKDEMAHYFHHGWPRTDIG